MYSVAFESLGIDAKRYRQRREHRKYDTNNDNGDSLIRSHCYWVQNSTTVTRVSPLFSNAQKESVGNKFDQNESCAVSYIHQSDTIIYIGSNVFHMVASVPLLYLAEYCS